ncbi:MAG TPA: YdcF family protein [Candidatus Angelobacter sp.]|nr:YdcF family protein [Candidatus Angelobacter sp.]
MGYLVVTAARVARVAHVDQAHPADAIVVFGAAEYVGRPSPVYRARLDHAFALFEQGLAPLIITTGGSGKDSKFSEGQVGRDYLAKRGVPDVNLIAETQASDTEQSAQRVAVILEANELKSVLLVSDAYHLYRGKRMMEREGITVYTSPRPGSVPKTALGRGWAALREAVSYTIYRLHME